MSFADEIDRDVQEVDAIMDEVFTWQGKEYDTVPDKFTREVTVSDDGNPVTIALSLRCRVALFDDGAGGHIFPVSGQKLLFDGTEYRVLRTRSKHFVVLWIDCVDVNV